MDGWMVDMELHMRTCMEMRTVQSTGPQYTHSLTCLRVFRMTQSHEQGCRWKAWKQGQREPTTAFVLGRGGEAGVSIRTSV